MTPSTQTNAQNAAQNLCAPKCSTEVCLQQAACADELPQAFAHPRWKAAVTYIGILDALAALQQTSPPAVPCTLASAPTLPPDEPAAASTSRKKSTELRWANLNLSNELSVFATYEAWQDCRHTCVSVFYACARAYALAHVVLAEGACRCDGVECLQTSVQHLQTSEQPLQTSVRHMQTSV